MNEVWGWGGLIISFAGSFFLSFFSMSFFLSSRNGERIHFDQ